MRLEWKIGKRATAFAVGLAAAGAIAVLAWRLAEPSRGVQEGAALATGAVGALAEGAPAGFTGSQSCAACHPAETQAWLSSQHAHAMRRAEEGAVQGDFGDVRVEDGKARARFFRKGGRFMVETDGRDGKPAVFEVSDTFGVYPLQQYLVTFPDGRRQALPFAYDTRPAEQGGQRWFYLHPGQTVNASDPLHWTGIQQNWNFMCAECHSTGLRKNYDAAADRFDTRFSEISVGCEACHGPAQAHVKWAAGARDPAVAHAGFVWAAPVRPTPDWTPDPKTGSPAHGVSRPAGDEVETCARCHSRRGILSEQWHPGLPLSETHAPALLSKGLFAADGQMEDEVFNDQTFKQSLMYARGVTCSDCHEPHAGKLRAQGAAVCAQCHLPARFETAAHTGHRPGPGAPDCVSCHMPVRTYMVIDDRHDHSFRIPRPDLSVALGTPNACTGCHRDKSAEWAANAVERWHGPVRKGFQTWAAAFHHAREGAPEARDALIRLSSTPATPAIVRATAISELGGFLSLASGEAIRNGLADPDPLVRVAALQEQAGLPLNVRCPRVSPLLSDPVAGVRIEAASQLADQPLAALAEPERVRLSAAFREYEAAQRLNADRPEGRVNLGNFYARRGDPKAAEAEFLAGLKLQPGSDLLSVNLADLYRALGREAETEEVLRRAVAVNPQAAAPHHALALSLIRQRRYDQALAELDRARVLAPDNARYAYVYAVALQSLGRAPEGNAVIAEALRRSPNDVELLTYSLNEALRSGDLGRARGHARKLALLRPDDADIARLQTQLR